MNIKLIDVLRARIERFRVTRMMRDEFESAELRRYFAERHGVVVGMYSYGCFDVRRIPRGTHVGRYCSFAPTAFVFNGNHGLSFLSLHPYLYNPALGVVDKEAIERSSCTFDDDVWVGHAAIILPGVRRVGRGAVIAAGAVVTKDVPPYAVVAGNPAVVKRYRFTDATVHLVEKSQWWTLDRQQLQGLTSQNPALVYGPQQFFESAAVSAGEAVEPHKAPI